MYDEKKDSHGSDPVDIPPILTQNAPPADETCKPVTPDSAEITADSAIPPADSVAGDLPCKTPPPALSELAELRQELTSLRSQLSELSERNAVFARIGAECADFRSLYPDVSPDDIPDSVWEMTEQGIPLSAAFALRQRKEACKASLADRVNRENASRATERADSPQTAYFTRDEVSKMSRADIRRHYGNILLSMSKWN